MHSPLAATVIPARHYTNAARTSGDMRLVVIHTMESPEGLTTAEDVSRWAAGSTAPQASWHYAVDADSVVACVEEEDIAWAAPPMNQEGVQVEHAGRANQTAAQWADAYSRGELTLSARLVADVCRRRGIPARRLTNAQLAAGERGIVGHDQVTAVWHASTHTDPGSGFPWDAYIRDVKALMPDRRRWQFRLVTAKGEVVDHSVITGLTGYAPRLAAFTARVAPQAARLSAAGRGPRIQAFRVQ